MNTDSETMALVKGTEIVRKDMFIEKEKFQSSFSKESLGKDLPNALKMFVSLIVQGPKIMKTQNHNVVGDTKLQWFCPTCCFSIVQTIPIYNLAIYITRLA